MNRAIEFVVKGHSGGITVNRQSYNGVMPPQQLNDEQIADVLTYVYNNWDNNKTIVTQEQVRKVKSQKK